MDRVSIGWWEYLNDKGENVNPIVDGGCWYWKRVDVPEFYDGLVMWSDNPDSHQLTFKYTGLKFGLQEGS